MTYYHVQQVQHSAGEKIVGDGDDFAAQKIDPKSTRDMEGPATT